MSINEVVEHSVFSWEQVFYSIFEWGNFGELLLGIVVLSFVFCGLAAIIKDGLEGGIPSKEAFFYIICFTVVVGFFMGMIVRKHSDSNDLYKNWKKEYVKPYIESLPEVSYEIQKVEEVRIGLFSRFEEEVGEKIFSSKPDVEKVYRVTYLKDGYPYTHVGFTSLRFTEGNKKELTAKLVEKDLGRDLKKGLYKTEIQLPKDYKIEKITESEVEI